MAAVNFFNETTEKVVLTENELEQIAALIFMDYSLVLQSLNVILLSDEELHSMNVEYLGHDDYTDIITFDYSEEKDSKSVEGELYISLDRIMDNAGKFGVPTREELLRVVIHGCLHLCGIPDKVKKERKVMQGLEDKYLKEIVSRET